MIKLTDYLNLELYEYHFIYPDNYDEQEDQSTISVELDNLSVVDTVDITSGLISSGSVVYLNGGLHTFFAYKVSESNDYIGRQKMLLYNK